MIWRFAPLAGILLTTGCSLGSVDHGIDPRGYAAWNVGALELTSVMTTKKTMGDHVATWITGKDCSSVRAEREGVWCVDWPVPPAPPQQVYCYASLARPSCYSQPYNEGNDRLIGFVPAPTPLRR